MHGGICSPTHMVSATWRLSGCVELILRFAERSFVLRRKVEKQLLVRGVLMMCCFSITVYRCSIFAAATCSYQAHKKLCHQQQRSICVAGFPKKVCMYNHFRITFCSLLPRCRSKNRRKTNRFWVRASMITGTVGHGADRITFRFGWTRFKRHSYTISQCASISQYACGVRFEFSHENRSTANNEPIMLMLLM